MGALSSCEAKTCREDGQCRRLWQGNDGMSDKKAANILLMQSAARGDTTDVLRALEMGAHPDTIMGMALALEDSGNMEERAHQHITALMRASSNGHVDVAKCLLVARASPKRRDSRGWTPLCHALGAGELAAARELLALFGATSAADATVQRLKSEVLEACAEECGGDVAAKLSTSLDQTIFFEVRI